MTLTNKQHEQITRWRLILGQQVDEQLGKMAGSGSCQLNSAEAGMDSALAAIYDETQNAGKKSQRGAGLGASAPHLAKWLGDIRTYFQEEVVSVIQRDAIERRGLRQLLFEPEVLKNVEPDVHLVSQLISLSHQIPDQTKETARMVVRAVVERIKELLESRLRQAVNGALNRRQHSPIPHVASTDWHRTIRRNLHHYDIERKRLIPERFWFFSRQQRSNNWTVIVAMDQSGSMAESVVYGAVTGAIFASLPATETRVVAFDTEVVDLTEACGDDPVDMLFGVQLGGGTDINKSVQYCQQYIHDPARTLFILITDLMEGGNEVQLIRRLEDIVQSEVRVLCLLALSDSGIPFYDERLARKLGKLGIPCFGCTPQVLPDMVGATLRGDDISDFAQRFASQSK